MAVLIFASPTSRWRIKTCGSL